jgi:hypothetical protein
MSVSKRNSEGYIDMTAFHALSNIAKSEKKQHERKLKMKKVFICSRYRADENHTVEDAIGSAYFACARAIDKGYAPYAPHLYLPHWLDDNDPVEREMGMAVGRTFLEVCDEVWQWGKTITEGMATELAYAKNSASRLKYSTQSGFHTSSGTA